MKGSGLLRGQFLPDWLRPQVEPLLRHPQKPLIDHDVFAERPVAQKPAAGKLLERMWQQPGESFEAAVLALQAGVQHRNVRREILCLIVPISSEYGVRRHQPRLDRRTNAFAALRISQSRRISHQQHAVVEHLALETAKQPVRVSSNAAHGSLHAARLTEVADELLHMARDLVRVRPAESDVEIVALAKHPAISQHVATEEQLRNLALDL